MRKFSDFINDVDNQYDSIKSESKQSSESVNQEHMEELINKYSEYTNDELLSEFMKMTMEKKKKGELNQDELVKIKESLSPYLSEEQKNNLDKLLNMVSHV